MTVIKTDIKCKCGKPVNHWDTFCYHCGNWIDDENNFDFAHLGRIWAINFHFNYEDPKYFSLPNHSKRTITKLAPFYGHMFFIGRTQAFLAYPDSNDIANKSFNSKTPLVTPTGGVSANAPVFHSILGNNGGPETVLDPG